MKNLLSVFVISIILFSCKKTDINNQNSGQSNQTALPVSGIWTFNFDNNVEGGGVDGYTKEYVLNNGHLIVGGNSNSSDTENPLSIIEFSIKMPPSGIVLGSYFTNTDSSNYFNFENALSVNPYGGNAYMYYAASISTKAIMQINITKYDTVTKSLNCTFSGNVQKDTSLFAVDNGVVNAEYSY